MFYANWGFSSTHQALLIQFDIHIKTSKHAGIISTFDKEFIHKGKLDKHFSRTLHKSFKVRQEADYKKFVELSLADAANFVKSAEEFLAGLKDLIVTNESLH